MLFLYLSGQKNKDSMNNYHFLVSEREQGRYDEYMRRGLIGLNLNEWIEVEIPKKSMPIGISRGEGDGVTG